MTLDDLLQAVIERPDDDARRLIFADWLLDHGEPERAAFIRVQLDLAKAAEKDERRHGLKEREKELLARHEEEWVRPVRNRVVSWVFHRGFITEVTVTVDAYMKHTFDLVRLAPIRRMWIERTGSVEFSVFATGLVPESIARESLILPLGQGHLNNHDCLVVAVPSPIDHDLMQKLNFVLKRNIAPVEAHAGRLEEAINRRYGQQ
jgi:uncharacterized protein (TIGR02996 family)